MEYFPLGAAVVCPPMDSRYEAALSPFIASNEGSTTAGAGAGTGALYEGPNVLDGPAAGELVFQDALVMLYFPLGIGADGLENAGSATAGAS